MAQQGNVGRGGCRGRKGNGKGACGGTPRRDGSGGGIGNRGTKQQPPKKLK
jgi:hypothetical protein